jgi:hypothetical protein
MTTSYVNPYTGQTVSPSQVGYESLTISTDTILQWPINGTTGYVVANIIDVVATASGLNLYLPVASAVSVGQAFIIRNIGTVSQYSFTVVNNAGTTIINIPVAPTTSTVNTYYIYLTDNSTTYGTWSTIAMGIGTSAANSATLAGLGLKAITNTLNSNLPVTTNPSTGYTFTALDRAALYVWSSGAGTLNLPTVASVGAGWFVAIKNDGTGILTVAPQGASKIDGTASSVQIQIANSSVFATDGTDWYTYALAQTNVFNYTQLLLSVTGAASTITLTAAQAKNVIQNYAGTLSYNTTIYLPQTVQLYSIKNSTSGSYTLSFAVYGVSGGTTISVSQGTNAILICDGTNVYSGTSSTQSFATSLTVGNGSAAAPSVNFSGDSTTGIFLAASGQLGFAVGGVSAGAVTASGLLLTVGINSGTF